MAKTISSKFTLNEVSQSEKYENGELYNSAFDIRLELRLDITQYPTENKSVIEPSLWWVATGKLREVYYVSTGTNNGFKIYNVYNDIVCKTTEIETSSYRTTSYSVGEGETKEQRVVWHNKSITVYHEIDGTAKLFLKGGNSVKISGFTQYGESGGYRSVDYGDVTVELPAFNRGEIILTAASFNDEENPVITYSAKSSRSLLPYNVIGFKDDVSVSNRQDYINYVQAAISFDGVTDDIEYRDIPIEGTSYTFALTDAEREVLRQKTANTNSAEIYFLTKVMRTVEDAIGHEVSAEQGSAVMRTLSIINAEPAINPVVIDTNERTVALTGDNNVLVKYASNASAALNVSTKKCATLADYNINNGANVADAIEHTFNAVESNYFYFYVKDSRKNSVHSDMSLKMVDYVKLTCNMSNNKPNTDGNMVVACYGNYFNGSFGAQENSLQVQYRYKVRIGGGDFCEWIDMVVTKNDNTYSASATLSGLDYQETYVFECRAIDKLMTTSSEESALKSLPVFDWSSSDFNFNVPVKFNGVEIDYILEQGTKNSWNYRKWKSGFLEMWGKVSVQPNFNNPYGNGWNTDTIRVELPFEVEDITSITGISSDMTHLSGAGNSSTYVWFALAAPHSISTTKSYDVYLDIKGICKQEE